MQICIVLCSFLSYKYKVKVQRGKKFRCTYFQAFPMHSSGKVQILVSYRFLASAYGRDFIDSFLSNFGNPLKGEKKETLEGTNEDFCNGMLTPLSSFAFFLSRLN